MTTESIILIGVGIYLAAMLAIGALVSGKSKTTEDFIVAGRSMPLWLSTATVTATWFGGGMMLGAAGAAYEGGLLGVIADPFGATLCLLLVGFFFARLFRRLRLLTFIDFVDNRFGKVAATVTACITLISNIGWTGGMLVAFGIIFQTLTGTPMEIGIVAGAIVIFVYTAVGGMWAVALTDFFQMTIIGVGLIMLFVVVLIDVGGWSAITAQLPEHTFRMVPLEHSADRWMGYIRAWVIFGLADVSSQTLLQRAMAAKSERVAQNAFYLGGLGYLMLGMIPVSLGIIASVTMPGLADPESLIPALAIDHLHPIAVAVFVGAMLAALMSTSDSALLSAAAVITSNLLPLVRRAPSDRLRLNVARFSIPVCGTIAIIVALKVRAVYELVLDANILVLACVVVPFIVGVWWRRANRSGALAAMAAGLLAWLMTGLFAPELPGDLIGLLASFVVMMTVTPLTQKSDPPRPLLDGDGNEVEFKDRLGILTGNDRA